MSVREEPEEDELERLSLPDDRRLDFVEGATGKRLDLSELHLYTASNAATTCSSSRGEMPRLSRSSGAARSGRTSSHAASPRTAWAASGSVSSEIRLRD